MLSVKNVLKPFARQTMCPPQAGKYPGVIRQQEIFHVPCALLVPVVRRQLVRALVMGTGER